MDWVDSKGTLLLKENTRFVFRECEDPHHRSDHPLTAMKDPVVFGDSKEGVLGTACAQPEQRPIRRIRFVRRKRTSRRRPRASTTRE